LRAGADQFAANVRPIIESLQAAGITIHKALAEALIRCAVFAPVATFKLAGMVDGFRPPSGDSRPARCRI
jgi:hypothetical protein